MTEHVCGKPQPGLLDMPGVTPEQVGGFYEAAAAFFRQAPWKKVGYEAAIKVECDKFQSGPWYAVLMGQSGLTTGLALYEDLKALRRMWAGDRGDEDNARQTRGHDRHLRGGVGHPRGRPGGGEEVRLAGGPARRLPGGLPQGAGPVAAPAAGLGTGTDGRVPAGGPGVREPAQAGRPGQGRNDGAGGVRAS